jgi:hypothetical protein
MPTYVKPDEVPFPSPGHTPTPPASLPGWHGSDTLPQLPSDPHTGCAPPDNGVTILEFFENAAKAEAEARARWNDGRAETNAAVAQAQANLVELRAKLTSAETAVNELGPPKSVRSTVMPAMRVWPSRAVTSAAGGSRLWPQSKLPRRSWRVSRRSRRRSRIRRRV